MIKEVCEHIESPLAVELSAALWMRCNLTHAGYCALSSFFISMQAKVLGLNALADIKQGAVLDLAQVEQGKLPGPALVDAVV